MPSELSFVIRADIQEIPAMNENLAGYLSSEGVPENEILDIQLAVEEAVTNTIKHGYKEKPGSVWISCKVLENTIEIVIQDEAIPFDPLTLPPPDIMASAEDRPIGGLGVMLIRNLMKDVAYRYENGRNILTLVRERGATNTD